MSGNVYDQFDAVPAPNPGGNVYDQFDEPTAGAGARAAPRTPANIYDQFDSPASPGDDVPASVRAVRPEKPKAGPSGSPMLREQLGAVGDVPYGEGAGYLIDNPVTRGLGNAANSAGSGLAYYAERAASAVDPDAGKWIGENIQKPLLDRGHAFEAPKDASLPELGVQTISHVAGALSLARLPGGGALRTAAVLGVPAAGDQAAHIEEGRRDAEAHGGEAATRVSLPRLGALAGANTVANLLPASVGGGLARRLVGGAVLGTAGNELVNAAAGNPVGTGDLPAAVMGAALGGIPHPHAAPGSLSDASNAIHEQGAVPVPESSPDGVLGRVAERVVRNAQANVREATAPDAVPGPTEAPAPDPTAIAPSTVTAEDVTGRAHYALAALNERARTGTLTPNDAELHAFLTRNIDNPAALAERAGLTLETQQPDNRAAEKPYFSEHSGKPPGAAPAAAILADRPPAPTGSAPDQVSNALPTDAAVTANAVTAPSPGRAEPTASTPDTVAQGPVPRAATNAPLTAAQRDARLVELQEVRRTGELTPDQSAELLDLHQLDRVQARVSGNAAPIHGVRKIAALDDATRDGTVPAEGRLFVDADNFKKVNDTFGHHVGDDVIRGMGETLAKAFPDQVFHRGGDEFVVAPKDEAAAHRGMEQARQELQDLEIIGVDADGNQIQQNGIGVSYGYGKDTQSAEQAQYTDKERRQRAGLRSDRTDDNAGTPDRGTDAAQLAGARVSSGVDHGAPAGRSGVSGGGQAEAVAPARVPTSDPTVLRQRIVAGDRIDPVDVHALLGDKPLGPKDALEALRELKGDQTVTADYLSDIPRKRVGKLQKFDPLDVARAARDATTDRTVLRQRIVASDRIDLADVHALLGAKPLGPKDALEALRELKGDQTVTADYMSDIPSRRVGMLQKFDPLDVARAARTPPERGTGSLTEGQVQTPAEASTKTYPFPNNSEKVSGVERAPPEPANVFDQFDSPPSNTLGDASSVETAARASAAHPDNLSPEPSAAQHEANNFPQGHINLHGLDVTIQVPKGGLRRGTVKDGAPWERPASDHYGHIRGTESADGEPVDVYLGPHAEAPDAKVFVIDQVKPGTSKYDESKAMIGFASGKDARRSYEANFPKGLKTFGGIRAMSIDQFKSWVKDGSAARRPAADAVLAAPETPAPIPASQRPTIGRQEGIQRLRDAGMTRKDADAAFHGIDRGVLRPDLRPRVAVEALATAHRAQLVEAARRPPVRGQRDSKAVVAERARLAIEDGKVGPRDTETPAAAAKPPGPTDAEPLYSRASVVQGEPTSDRLPVENVERIAKDFLARYNGHIPLKVRIGKTLEDIYGPGSAAELGNAKGAYHARSGFLTLAADRVSSRADAETTLRHEILGHYGLNTLAPADKRAVLDAIVEARSAPSLRATWEKIDRVYADKPELVRAEEVFADLAGRDRSTLGAAWDRILTLLHQGLRKIGLVRGPTSRAELQDLARRIGAGIRSGERVQQTFPADDQSQFGRDQASRAAAAQADAERLRPPLLAHRDDSGAATGHLDDDQRAALGKIGSFASGEALSDKARRLTHRWREKLVQGMVDQFAPIKVIDREAYMQMRLSRGSDGALEATFLHGTPKLTDGAYDVTPDGKGLRGVLTDLKGEHDLFLAWIAGNRAARLKAEDRENLFSPADIRALQSLDRGVMADGRNRSAVYKAAHAQFNRYQKAILDIGEHAGLFNAESRAQWVQEFYVPFFRDLEKEPAPAGTTEGIPNAEAGTEKVVKELKGGTQPLGDLLSNTLENWSRILTASMRNMAASKALQSAERMGIAERIEKADDRSVRVLREGKPEHYTVKDPLVLDALTMLNFNGESNRAVRVLSQFKRALSFGVTINPAFRVRNLLRDSLSALAVSDVGHNPLRNIVEGWRATGANSETFHRLLASGGAVRFGALNDGEQAAHAKRLVAMGIKDGQILDTPGKIKNAFNHAWEWWKELGDRGETVNRAVIYDRARANGASHLEAAYQARDLLDFTMGGKWAATQFLAHTVPFLNARVQGIYRLGRGARENPLRFASVTGAVALASMVTYLAQKDDPEFRSLPDWARDTYWCVKLGDQMLFLPKPFEIGALGSVVERGTELVTAGDDYRTSDFARSLLNIAVDQLSMNPIPQAVKPLAETLANYDTFQGRPIDSLGQQRLPPEDRYTSRTSAPAVGLGKALGISPQRLDFLVRGYFGWLGLQALNVADLVSRPLTDLPSNPNRDVFSVSNWPLAGDFVKSNASMSSKYVDRFYTNQKQTEQLYAAYSAARKAGDVDRAQELAGTDAVRLRKLHNALNRNMQDINQRLRRVNSDRSLGAGEKRTLLDGLYEQRNRIAEQADTRLRAAEQ